MPNGGQPETSIIRGCMGNDIANLELMTNLQKLVCTSGSAKWKTTAVMLEHRAEMIDC